MSSFGQRVVASGMDSTQQHAASGSPNSSEEIESHHGTPETKISSYSPEDFRVQTKTGAYGMVRSNLPPAFTLSQTPDKSSPKAKLGNLALFGAQDPFVSNLSFPTAARGANDHPKLSPVASTFTPFKFKEHAPVETLPEGLSISVPRANAHPGIFNLGSLGHLATTPVSVPGPAIAETEKYSMPFGSEVPGASSSYSFSSAVSSGNIYFEAELIKIGEFSSDGESSRSLVISHIPRTTSSNEVDAFFNSENFSTIKHLSLKDLHLNGTIFVNFGDIRDAHKAYARVKSVQVHWTVQYIAGVKYSPLMYSGQVLVKADFTGPRQRFNPVTIGHIIKELLENYGEVMGFEAGVKNQNNATYRAEFYDTGSADLALAYLHGFRIAGCVLTMMRYKPDSSLHFVKNHGPLIVGKQDTGITRAFSSINLNGYSPVYDAGYPESPLTPVCLPNSASHSLGLSEYQSEQSLPSTGDYGHGFPTRSSGQTSPWSPPYSPYADFALQSSSWASLNPGAVGQERGTALLPQVRPGHGIQQQRLSGKPMGRQAHDYSSGHHNVVDVERIRLGTDVRTTIMLRNIPNKIDQAMLKDIVDETSFGKYDFMYLRIDFANNCNVGYAFINFEDPIHIIDFVNARAGHRWNRYNSDKVAEVSYATIQGRDCLVQKFRNSSVMLEHPSFRPKIFYTGQGSLVGTEEKFPGPDNPSKMRRSVENAEHVGLFAPRAGQNFRDEQRRRRSQYDRGTRLAEIEEAYEFSLAHHDMKNTTNHTYPAMPYGRLPRSYPHPGQENYWSPRPTPN